MMELFQDWTVAIVILSIASVADVITTRQGLASGAQEENPLLAWIMQKWGDDTWIAIKLIGTWIAAGLIYAFGAVWMIWALSALLAVVSWHNHRIGGG